MPKLDEWLKRGNRWIWGDALEELPRLQQFLRHAARALYVLTRDIAEGQLTLRAMSLVYTTLLSLVPLIAFSFSVLKGLGVHNRLEPMLFNALEPLGPRGEIVGERIMSFVDNVRADVLGSIGLALLIYLIISLVQKMEESFNYVWRVQQPRSFGRRFANYVTVILIGPLFIVMAISITATVTNNEVVRAIGSIEPFGTLVLILSHLLPYLIAVGVFTFVYVFVPNTTVRLWPALAGGVVAGLAWQTTGWVFANFIAGSARYVAIYSGFAILLTFMIWIYINWLILLIGAQVAFYVQNPRYIVQSRGRLNLSSELRECLAMEIMYLVGKAFHGGGRLWNLERLSRRLKIPADVLAEVTDRLEHYKLLLVTEPGTAFVPGKDLESISLEAVRSAVRRTDPLLDFDQAMVPISEQTEKLKDDVEAAARQCLTKRTLRDMVMGEERYPD